MLAGYRLISACEAGRKREVDRLLADTLVPVDVNCANNGATPLLMACKKNHGSIVGSLLAHPRIDVNLGSSFGTTPLILACNKDAIVDILLAHPDTRVNQADCFGITPLLAACRNGYYATFAKLLAHPDIDINFAAEGNTTPLLAACEAGRDKFVAALLARPDIDVNRDTRYKGTPLSMACLAGHHKVVSTLLGHPGIRINGHWLSCLEVACDMRYSAIVETLLAQPGVDVNCGKHVHVSTLLDNVDKISPHLRAQLPAGAASTAWLSALALTPRRVLVGTFGAYRAAKRSEAAAVVRARSWQLAAVQRLPRAALAELLAQLRFTL